MQHFTISGNSTTSASCANRIYCPALNSLTAPQADLAFVMPRMDHNRIVRESQLQGDWAALLASDPFGSEAAVFSRLHDLGYKGVTNWPSSILLDGTLRDSMRTVPAHPVFEYEFLARANAAGFQTMAFFLSLAQAQEAIKIGHKTLVLHPGVMDFAQTNTAPTLDSYKRLIESLKSEGENLTILVYSSAWHEEHIKLSSLDSDGLVWLEDHS